MYEQQLTFHSC